MNRRACGRPRDILLVDHSAEDVRLIQKALTEVKVRKHLFVVEDGVEAAAFLRHEGKYSDAVRPDLILLDLDLPRKDGYKVLAEIKTDANLRTIPVVVLTISQDDEDILKAYDLQTNCYITKPVDAKQLTRVVKIVEDFWLTTARLPTE